MAYEKKIEPLTKCETLMSGITLILFVICLEIIPFANSALVDGCDLKLYKLSVSDIDEMYEFHKCMKVHRLSYLIGSSFLLLGFPIILGHIYYENRLFETLFSFLNFGLARWLYLGSWFIVATIYCTILPSILIFIVYYDWEFSGIKTTSISYSEGEKIVTVTGGNNEYLGYAMQFQISQLFLILYDSLGVPLGFTAFLPWYLILMTLLGFQKSYYWQVQEERLLSILIGIRKCFSCYKISKVSICCLCVIMIIISIFGAFVNVFDYEKKGFFSYHGGSQFMHFILIFSWFVTAILNIEFGRNLEKIMKHIKGVVKANTLSELDGYKTDYDGFTKNRSDDSDVAGGSRTQSYHMELGVTQGSKQLVHGKQKKKEQELEQKKDQNKEKHNDNENKKEKEKEKEKDKQKEDENENDKDQKEAS